MKYEKQTFRSKQKLTAEQMNHIEDGLGNLYDAASLSPEDYGAVGDGIVDDHAALTAAMAAAVEAGVPLELTRGKTYRSKTYLELPSNLVLHGNGAVLLSDVQYETLWNDRPFVCITGKSNNYADFVHDIVFDGVTIRSADTCQSNMQFRVMRGKNIVVTNCVFDCDLNDQSRGCLDLYGVYENVRLENNVFRQLSAAKEGGIWVRNWRNDFTCQNVRIINCDFYKAGGDEVLAVWGWNGILKDVLISGCNFYEIDDEKYRSRGYYPAWGITLGQRGIRTDVRMENCVVRMNRCESLFRMLGDGTHAVVDGCDIYMDQPDDFPLHDSSKSANPMLAQGNGLDDASTLFQNCRVHLHGDNGRKICYRVGALRNCDFDVECGHGTASTKEVSGCSIRGKLEKGVFWDCNVVKNNVVDVQTSGSAWISGAGQVVGNTINLDIPNKIQGSSIFHNNWGAGSILDNDISMTIAQQCDIKMYSFPVQKTDPQYIQNNRVTITGARYSKLVNDLAGTIYRKNNFYNGIPERLFECTGVTFASEKITEQYKKYTKLAVNIAPTECTDPIIYTWTNEDGAVLDMGYGKYRPLKDGTARVTVNCGMYEATQDIEVKLVPVACETLKLSRTTALCGSGKTTYLKAFVTPYWTTDTPVWSSNAPDIAEVSQDGEITAKAIGSATITVKCGSLSASCALTVVDASQLPVYTDGAWALDNTVAYLPLPDLEAEHSVYFAFDIDVGCISTKEEIPLLTTLLSGQTGATPILITFACNSENYCTIRWYTTDVNADSEGKTTQYSVPFVNNGFEEIASTNFLYLKDGVANPGGAVVWNAATASVKAAPNSGYLSFNVQTNDADKPVTDYTTAATLKAALAAGNVHATKATGFKLRELIVFANSLFTTRDEFYKYRENAEIDIRFDESGNVLNAGTAGDIIWSN